ncbi:MAG: hypothetical protein HY231_19165 [Acidobacteria bacterium]|nr:hypothetical protein [Acidobacteriota bacterium]
MSQTVTLNLPDDFFQPLRRAAVATNQTIEETLLTALQASLPSLEGLPEELIEQLIALELLDDESLRQVMMEIVPSDQQQKIHELLARHQDHNLSDEEGARLTELQHQADLVMLRKAHAASLLRFRGKRLPTLAELQPSTDIS